MTNIITPKGRLSYPHLFVPNDSGNFPSGKYETTFVIEKSEDISALKNEVERILKEELPKIKNMSELRHPPIRDGDEEEKYPGCWFLKAKSVRKPKVVSFDPKNLADESEVYGGQNAKLSLNFFAYDNKGTKGIGVGLGNVQILGGGERIGGGSTNPEDEFKDEFNATVDSIF